MVRLGQNFLRDPNLLDAIVRDAGLTGNEVVLEVGAGEGVLTERLARVARLVQVVELDRGLEPALAGIASLENVDLNWADAVRFDFATLEPTPTVMVSNLPYAVAVPVILRTLIEIPEMSNWTVMVQREIAERLASPPGRKTYGIPSAIVQRAAEVRLVRKVGREVFRPRPRVDSAVISITRTAPPPDPEYVDFVRAGFAHRRKSLARSVEMAAPGSIERVREAIGSIGLEESVRAESLTPDQLARLAEMVGGLGDG